MESTIINISNKNLIKKTLFFILKYQFKKCKNVINLMKNQIQDLEIMDSFYKENNQNQSMADLKGSLNNNNIINEEETNNNNRLSPSMFTPKGEKKRRQGLWVNNFFTKEEEVKEETISSPQLVRIVETNNIKTITIFFRII